jgi:hypothetical protein
MEALNAGTRDQSSHAAHGEAPTAARLGGRGMPLPGSGVLVFAQTTWRENERARRKPQQLGGALLSLPLTYAD